MYANSHYSMFGQHWESSSRKRITNDGEEKIIEKNKNEEAEHEL